MVAATVKPAPGTTLALTGLHGGVTVAETDGPEAAAAFTGAPGFGLGSYAGLALGLGDSFGGGSGVIEPALGG